MCTVPVFLEFALFDEFVSLEKLDSRVGALHTVEKDGGDHIHQMKAPPLGITLSAKKL